jgi:predicted nuclease of predicted toxin-antitoxin system
LRIKLDENLPRALKDWLLLRGHDADTVPDEGIRGAIDAVVWEASQAEGRLLITQDLDFSDIRAFPPGSHGGVVLLRLADPDQDVILQRMREVAAEHRLEDFVGCLVVVSDVKVRVVRAPGRS